MKTDMMPAATGTQDEKVTHISILNGSLPELMMGVETPLPLFAMDAAAPKGAPLRPQLPDFLEAILAPPCPARGHEAGRPQKNIIIF